MTVFARWTLRPLAVGRTAVGALVVSVLIGASPDASLAKEQVFQTPEQAVEAFRAAVYSPRGEGLVTLFGPEHKDDLVGGDPAAARLAVNTLRVSVADGVTLEEDGADRRILVIGRQAWPMPVPLVKGPEGWSFNVDEGIEEINDRRIGRNELSAIALCRAYMDAQIQYARADRDGDEVLEYAQKLASAAGQRDGLYWEAGPAEEISPLGPLAAEAEQYLDVREAGEPFRGYYFRILKGQGEHAPGGKHDYVINDNMIAGYGLLAYPAEYGSSGIMSFLCGNLGKVFEKDLGEDTEKVAAGITVYDPDDTWEEVTE